MVTLHFLRRGQWCTNPMENDAFPLLSQGVFHGNRKVQPGFPQPTSRGSPLIMSQGPFKLPSSCSEPSIALLVSPRQLHVSLGHLPCGPATRTAGTGLCLRVHRSLEGKLVSSDAT